MCMQNEKYLPLLSLPATKTFSCESHRDVDQNWARFLWGLCWILPCPQRTFQGELDFEFYGQVLFSTFWNWLWYQRLCRGSFYHRHLLSRPHDVVEDSQRFVETYPNFRNRNPWYDKRSDYNEIPRLLCIALYLKMWHKYLILIILSYIGSVLVGLQLLQYNVFIKKNFFAICLLS